MKNNIKHTKIKEGMRKMIKIIRQILRQKTWFFIILVPILILCASCEEEEQPEPTPESTSIGGAVLETGYEIDDDKRIVTPQTAFEAREDFYFSFYNNEPFGVDEVKVELIYSETEEVKADNTYEVDPGWKIVADMIWFGQPGLYKISVEVGDEVRATREVIIE